MLVILAIIPPLLIVFLINRYCGTGREYLKRFLLLFLVGGLLITVAAMFGSDALTRGAGAILGSGFLFILFSNFITVALPEEALKYIVLRWRMVKGDPFEKPLYAIALSVTVTMGFSFYEQMVYTLGEGLATVIMRAILSVPGHMAHAILMGWFLYLAACCGKAADAVADGTACAAACDPAGRKKNLRLALIVPTLTHGTYDFIVGLYQQSGSDLFIAALFAFWAALLFYTIRLLRRLKRESAAAAQPASPEAPTAQPASSAATTPVINAEPVTAAEKPEVKEADPEDDPLTITIEYE